MKDTSTKDPMRAGYLSLYILWNKPSLSGSILDYKKRLNIWNKTGVFPTEIVGYNKPKNARTKFQKKKNKILINIIFLYK